MLAGFDNELFDRTLELTPEMRVVLSVWQVPQTEFHSVLLSYLIIAPDDSYGTSIEGVIVYGSVARGEAKSDSDLDLLIVRSDEVLSDVRSSTVNWPPGRIESRENQIISELYYPESAFHDALEQALSAGIAARGEEISYRHGAKIQHFFDPLGADELEEKAFRWHARRSDAQYVDSRGAELSVPSANFDRDDAQEMLTDATEVIRFVRNRSGNEE